MNFTIITKKILRNKNDYGLFTTFKKSIAYIIKPFYENKTYRIYRLNLDSYQFMPSSGCTYIFRWIDHDDTILIEQIENMEEWLKGKVRILLQRSYLCMVALDGEKVAGFNIISLDKGRLALIAFSKKLRDHEAWSVQITVNKNYRGKGLATELRYRVFNELKKMGLKKIYGGAQISNIASLNLAQKVGFKNIADIQYIKILNREKYHYMRINK